MLTRLMGQTKGVNPMVHTSDCTTALGNVNPPLVGPKATRFKASIRNVSAVAAETTSRGIWDLVVFGFEIEMLRLHMHTLHPVVAGFLVSESSVRFQTMLSKPALLSDGIRGGELPSYMHDKTRVEVLSAADCEKHCPTRSRSRYSGRCFQALQRFVTLQMLLRHAAPDDLALVADVDEIARPELLGTMRRCHPFGAGSRLIEDGGIFVMKARQFKFGVHCDTGEVWHQGPKLYSVRWLRAREASEGPWTSSAFDELRTLGSYGAPTVTGAAWHLTSFGSTEQLVRKLTSFGAANLFSAPHALDPVRIEACTSRCLELLDRGKPSMCHDQSARRPPRLTGVRLRELPGADLPPALLEQPGDFPPSWFAFLAHNATSSGSRAGSPSRRKAALKGGLKGPLAKAAFRQRDHGAHGEGGAGHRGL